MARTTQRLNERQMLTAGTRLGGPARFVAYYTPLGAYLAITVASFLSARTIWGPDHVAAHWWALGLGSVAAVAVIVTGLRQIRSYLLSRP